MGESLPILESIATTLSLGFTAGTYALCNAANGRGLSNRARWRR
ncbi:hypothetical protein [Phormidium nigroviride]